MGWTCNACPAREEGDDLSFPILHELQNPGHVVQPDATTAFAWERVLGEGS